MRYAHRPSLSFSARRRAPQCRTRLAPSGRPCDFDASSPNRRSGASQMQRRDFLQHTALIAGGAAIGARTDLSGLTFPLSAPERIALAPKITDAERLARIDKARRLMAANGID